MQASQEQNFGDGGCKRVVIGMDQIQSNRKGVIWNGWKWHWEYEGKDWTEDQNSIGRQTIALKNKENTFSEKTHQENVRQLYY